MTPSATSPNDPTRLQEEFDYFLRTAGVPRGPGGPPVAGDGPGGDNGGMDRLDHLEKRVDTIDARLGRIEGDVGTIKDGLTDLKIGIAELNAKFNIGEIRANVEKSHTDIYKWIATLALSLIGVVAAVYFGIQRLGPPVAQIQSPTVATQPAPSPTPAR
jgi:hypothetical protein